MKVKGKKVEIEYIKDYGLQNALHLIMRQPDNTMYKYLVDEVKVKFDEGDFLGRNPFMVNV
jgi:capsule polysaccharide export protein KpsE/RkpR